MYLLLCRIELIHFKPPDTCNHYTHTCWPGALRMVNTQVYAENEQYQYIILIAVNKNTVVMFIHHFHYLNDRK